MPRRNRLGSQIHSFKHVIDSDGALTGGGASVTTLATVVNARSDPIVITECEVGDTVNGIFLSVFAIGAGGQGLSSSINWYVAKARANQNPVSDFPNPQAVGSSPVRNQIFHQEKGLAGSADGTPMAFKGVIVVPKGMRRMRDGDSIFVKINSLDATNDATFCIRAIYKSFS